MNYGLLSLRLEAIKSGRDRQHILATKIAKALILSEIVILCSWLRAYHELCLPLLSKLGHIWLDYCYYCAMK
jgi:hypothetical protein